MSADKSRMPVTILNGFLGAGKTTLLQNLLVQGRALEEVQLGVIVNEMSELDVDGLLLDTSELMSLDDALMATIPAGSMSSDVGLAAFETAVDQCIRAGANHILIETSGSTHPWPLLERIEQSGSLRLHGFFSVVDTHAIAHDYDFGRSIVPVASQNLANKKRGIENLLAEQIMFANHILLSKMDRVAREELQAIGEAIHPINPYAEILGMQWGNLRLETVLSAAPYDHARVAQLGAELRSWDQENDTSSMVDASDYSIDSVVISDSRPFHPERLWNVYNHFLGKGIYRSKGFFWLPTRDQFQLLWNQTAGSVGLAVLNYWKVAALEDETLVLTPEERQQLRDKLSGFSDEFGDRHCQLTIIGDKDGLETFADAVRECFCTPQEIAQWKAGHQFADPWPDEAR